VLRFPRPGPPEAAFPDVGSTIRALRLPASTTGSLIDSLPRSNFVSPSSLLRSGDFHAGPVPLQAAAPSAICEVGRSPDLPGSWRIHPIPLPRSRTPVGSSSPRRNGLLDVVPTLVTVKTPAFRQFRGSITRLWYPLPTLHVHVTVPYARLASGRWLTLAGWESNPLDSNEEFLLLT
jgi:hypothetical protein